MATKRTSHKEAFRRGYQNAQLFLQEYRAYPAQAIKLAYGTDWASSLIAGVGTRPAELVLGKGFRFARYYNLGASKAIDEFANRS